jgi:hypothetical protein
MSKGSIQRPLSVPRERFEGNWNKIFKEEKMKPTHYARTVYATTKEELEALVVHEEKKGWEKHGSPLRRGEGYEHCLIKPIGEKYGREDED